MKTLYSVMFVVILSVGISGHAYGVTTISADDPYIQYFGRWDFTDALNPKTSWGNSIKAKFEGSSISVVLSHLAGEVYFQCSIDGGEYTTFVSSGTTTHQLATGLGSGEHTLHLVRRLEASYGITTFLGIELDDGADLVEPAPKPELKFEFIGDSITAGFGSEGPHTAATDNVFETYGPRVARMFGGQWSSVARSGIGISVNINGTEPSMPTRYGDAHFSWGGDMGLWDFTSYIPDVVTVFLGTNDYVFDNPSKELFEGEYIKFVETVRSNYPNAHIFLINPLVGTVPWPTNADRWAACKGYLQNIVNHFNTNGDSKVYFVETGTQDNPWLVEANYSGDMTHPNMSGHGIIADNLYDVMEPIINSMGYENPTGDTDAPVNYDTDSSGENVFDTSGNSSGNSSDGNVYDNDMGDSDDTEYDSVSRTDVNFGCSTFVPGKNRPSLFQLLF